MHIASNDPRWKTREVSKADPSWKTGAQETSPTGEIKSKEVLHINEDLNILASKMKTLDLDLAKEWNKLEDEHRHTEAELFRPPLPLRQLSRALQAVRGAHEAVETASRALNDAAQYFEG